MILKVQELPGVEGRGIKCFIHKAKLLQDKQNNFCIVQKNYKTPPQYNNLKWHC